MKLSLLAALCALLLFLPAAPRQSSAAEVYGGYERTNQTADTHWSRLRQAELRINATLDRTLRSDLALANQPLDGVLDMLSEEYGFPILFDMSALEEFGVSPETEVSITVSGISLRSAMNLMLLSPGLEDLTYTVQDEVLLITTKDRANERLVTRVCPVADLLPRRGVTGEQNGFADGLIDMIVSCIAHDTWMENGTGQGEIQLVYPGLLVIAQTADVHSKVERLLADIRAAAAEITAE